jgi:hypothetical protein
MYKGVVVVQKTDMCMPVMFILELFMIGSFDLIHIMLRLLLYMYKENMFSNCIYQ